MEEPRSVRDVQKHTGRIAALNRFIPRSADRSLPFFRTLRSSDKFEWGEEQKKGIPRTQKLSRKHDQDDISQIAVHAALVIERTIEGRQKQLPIYFASEALSGSKRFFSELEKIAYAVVMASRKLRHYIEGHKIIAVTDPPLHDLLHNREA